MDFTTQSTPVNGIPNPEMQVREILMVVLYRHGKRPMLSVRFGFELEIYQAYRCPKGNLIIRFKKLDRGVIPGHQRPNPEEKLSR
ncbi:hypothetical protein K0M31_008929 [Melipona bicolor]|uniref:Uncharacterized protein n=1 Tax=Melipona bicolor TaxID=60889 RepID=A0AA40FQT0_9HYME|nr:hypothetical protein K0M31_008929 [Melipona bicolor]